MSNDGGLIPFVGTWSSTTFYYRGECVLRSGVLYQARTDRGDGKDPTGGAAYWDDMTSVVATYVGSIDPAAGSGVPAAIGSTYQRSGSGLLSKSGSGATAWTSGGGGGGVTVTGSQGGPVEATSILTAFEVTDNGGGEAGIAGTIHAPAGAEGTGDLLFEIQGETGFGLFDVDPYGFVHINGSKVDPTNGGGGISIKSADNTTVFLFTADNGVGPTTGSNAKIGVAGTQLGFFGADVVSRPEVPAIPTAQNIVDALVALGLVTQAS